ncbi:MAG: bifunctional (p)ppGpp synthetase/guanosine-3',5'-bis(diphosphate) 3'-pyrophosphohydrolase [Deltaproteobacteria bacterium]|nr:bifunctional (p)ppGpp synthetase/guanosine-3',5'-bis(diphosphate) 3'-pyrophosphohydrolase [Deltaproteobacteria bacterium]MDQ3301510.1 HD domain-containing protein [Myxococcota bacterium]
MFAPDRYVAALRFAAERHHGQHMQESQLPYLVHLVAVAAEVTAALPAEGVDVDVAIGCALLHDILEDTPTTRAELVERFGEPIAAGVSALTKASSDSLILKEHRMADSLARIRAQPPAVWIVKLADRITNLAPPPAGWSRDKRVAYRDEAMQIADALGGVCPQLDARIRAKIATYAAYL